MRRSVLCVLMLAAVTDAVRADELPSDTNTIQTLTVEQAEELVSRRSRKDLSLQ